MEPVPVDRKHMGGALVLVAYTGHVAFAHCPQPGLARLHGKHTLVEKGLTQHVVPVAVLLYEPVVVKRVQYPMNSALVQLEAF